MPDAPVLEIADRWWARDFACAPSDLRPDVTQVQAHAGRMVGAAGIWILVVGPAPLVSLPPGAMEALAERARTWSSGLVADPAALAAQVRPLVAERIVGPAFIGYGTEETLDLSPAQGARRLTPRDRDAVDRLRASCGDEEWDHGGSDPDAVPVFGCFDDRGRVLALAGYKTWGDAIAHIAIVAAPDHRGRGLATQAVARAARHALDAGLLPQHRTLEANGPSMGIARRLGFERYGFSVFVRLGADTPEGRTST